MKGIIVFVLLFSIQQASAQRYQLFPEMEINSLSMNEGELILMNGEVVKGELGLATLQTSSGLQRINSVRIHNGSETIKYKAKEIAEIRIKANWSDESLSEANERDGIIWDTKMKADYYIFKSISDKKGKTRLMQLLNPGFDHSIQVYVDPKSKDSSFAALVGDDTAKSYYVTKGEGHDGIYVKKSKYKKSFPSLFGGCKAMISEFGAKPRWSDFAQHIYHYDDNCD